MNTKIGNFFVFAKEELIKKLYLCRMETRKDAKIKKYEYQWFIILV
jgi:hypothetical protein